MPTNPVSDLNGQDGNPGSRGIAMESVWFGNLRVTSLFFVDDVVLLASSSQDLHGALEGFPAKCEVARIKVNTSREIHRRIRASSALMKAQLRSVCKSQEEKL